MTSTADMNLFQDSIDDFGDMRDDLLFFYFFRFDIEKVRLTFIN